jgi:YVTN family beta-propeller protein
MKKKQKKSLHASALQITFALSLVSISAILWASSFPQGKSGVTHGFEATMPNQTCVAFAYIANSGSNNVSVIDSSTNTVVATVTVGNSPHGVAVTPDNTHVYVTNDGSDTVSVIDTSTNTVVATVTVGDEPFGVAVTPDGSFVANQGGTVSVIERPLTPW